MWQLKRIAERGLQEGSAAATAAEPGLSMTAQGLLQQRCSIAEAWFQGGMEDSFLAHRWPGANQPEISAIGQAAVDYVCFHCYCHCHRDQAGS